MNRHPDHEYPFTAGRLGLFAGVLLLSAWPAMGEAAAGQSIYTWQDDNGRTHFADRPATSFNVEDLNPRKPFGYIEPDVPEKAPTPSAKRQDAEAPTTGLAKTASLPTVVPETVPDYQRNCNSAKNRLNELGRFQRLKVKNAEGKMVFMARAEKQALIDEARAAVRDNCNRR